VAGLLILRGVDAMRGQQAALQEES
jgi:hypothetical protein